MSWQPLIVYCCFNHNHIHYRLELVVTTADFQPQEFLQCLALLIRMKDVYFALGVTLFLSSINAFTLILIVSVLIWWLGTRNHEFTFLETRRLNICYGEYCHYIFWLKRIIMMSVILLILLDHEEVSCSSS